MFVNKESIADIMMEYTRDLVTLNIYACCDVAHAQFYHRFSVFQFATRNTRILWSSGTSRSSTEGWTPSLFSDTNLCLAFNLRHCYVCSKSGRSVIWKHQNGINVFFFIY